MGYFFFKMDIFFDLITDVLKKSPPSPPLPQFILSLFSVINRESHD